MASWIWFAAACRAADLASASSASLARAPVPSPPRLFEHRTEIDGVDRSGLGAASDVGDIDGDGHLDLVVTGLGVGEAHLYRGGPTGVDPTAAWDATDDLLDSFGAAVAVGDLNGDGYDDILVGVPDFSFFIYEGAAVAYFGSPTGPSATPAWGVRGHGLWEALGTDVAMGDLNGDGFADAAVGAPHGDGYIQVFLGSPSGPSSLPDWSLEGEPTGALGSQVSIADLNGDGFDDLVASSPGYDGEVEFGMGRVQEWDGGPSGPSTEASWSLYGRTSNQGLGTGLSAVGDVDADGFADLLIGDDFDEALLVRGSASGLETAVAWSAAGARDSRFGSAAVGADFDRDGFVDLVIGSPGQEWDSTTSRVDLFHGSAAGFELVPNWPTEFDDASGEGLALSAGDFDGDGYPDLVVGDSSYDLDSGGDGVVWVFAGGCYDLGDLDADRVGDRCDTCPGGDDRLDADADGFPDDCDACPNAADDQVDSDGDYVGDACDPCTDQDADGACVPDDCDDTDPAVFPGAPETCNGVDDACSGSIPPLEADLDDDGSPDCAEPHGRADPGCDCDASGGGPTFGGSALALAAWLRSRRRWRTGLDSQRIVTGEDQASPPSAWTTRT